MKKLLYGCALLALSLGSVSCDKQVSVTGISLEPAEVTLEMGNNVQLELVVTPQEAVPGTVVWTSSDAEVATVSETGLVTAVGFGEAEITATMGTLTAVAQVSVPMPEAHIGDFYYSDGTYSSELDPEKQVIGIVFWVGDPTASDPALAREHPNCTHGLVLASHQDTETTWQMYYLKYDASISEWIEANTDEYDPIETGKDLEDNLNKIVGYNNTKAIELFNADPANAAWPVEAVQLAVEYRTTCPAPENTSDWYLPSAKELSLMISGEMDFSIYDPHDPITDMRELMDERLAMVDGALPLVLNIGDYWSSCEENAKSAYFVTAARGSVFTYRKAVINYRARFVLAF